MKAADGRFHFQTAWIGALVVAIDAARMNELVFLIGLAIGVSIGLPALARLWQVDLRGALKRV